MSKRFIDTEIWDKEWFMQLSPAEKCAVIYIRSKCDCIGIWRPNFGLADFIIKEALDWEDFKKKVSRQFEFLPDGKWFDRDFCDFQYGELSENCKPHRKYIELLKKIGLFERVSKGYPKGIHTLQEQEQEKEKEKDRKEDGCGKGKNKVSEFVMLTTEEMARLKADYGETTMQEYIERLNDYLGQIGNPEKKYKSHYHTIKNWIRKDRGNGSGPKTAGTCRVNDRQIPGSDNAEKYDRIPATIVH